MLNTQHSELISLFFLNGITSIGEATFIFSKFFFLFFNTSVIDTDCFNASSFSMAYIFKASSLKFSTLKNFISLFIATT